ncbi:SusD/RagB family nutrient-binding outer membrane lipoprotein [Phnomibacter ginsenosidimutans]|uniref:SusD/RagB family nutrient-binding outer membrane lipoprotein n=1 Tax=Phnomibacter ginsenosidimutans TaxID=2676868 RepID=A0A6I6G9W9_9BACT|nr:SusD/RagB family nutrient-binding outer membrane lipoprotein [Phnomibacter ginsenosidimutans]QGW26840.1 SusD/RagB family nutrient-binding outer membrane lipoprotein [Phnomibacter ginsenosidimutans]
MKRTLLYIIAVVTVFSSITGCSKFDDINTNPDATENVNSAMLATNIILRNLKFQGRDAMAYLSDNGMAKYVAFANQSIMPSQYNALGATDFGAMTMLPNIESMLEYAKGSVMENSYKGLAKFSRAYMFYDITMKVGDIPYTGAGKAKNGEIEVKYDTQEEVLKGILDDLKEADAFFANGVKFDGDPSPYAGDPAKWRRASNAFALKVLLSLSKKSESSTLNVKQRFAEIVNAGFLLTPTTGYLGLNYSATNPHPMSGTNNLFTSRTIVSTTVIDNLKRYNDRRLFYYAEPAGAKISGGLLQSDTAAYVGANVSDDYDDITFGHSKNAYSLLNARYLAETAGDPRLIMSYPEQQLMLAEARVLGWITTGTAKEYYESGVKAALAFIMATKSNYAHAMPITQAYIDNYFTGEAAFKTLPADQLKQIWMQLYFLNFMQNPIPVYYNYRRTSYPDFPINPATSLNLNKTNAIPMRWLYPSSESNFNRANVDEAIQRQYEGVDEVNKLMWILK